MGEYINYSVYKSKLNSYFNYIKNRIRLFTNKEIEPNHPESTAINALISVLQDGDTFWDVGAMGGSYTRYIRAASQPESIHAFEPNPVHFKDCKQTVCSLPGKFKRQAHQIALSDESGTVYFATEMPSYANTSAGAIINDTDLNKFDDNLIVEVPVKTGDEIIQNNEVESPDVLKTDVEGAEMNVLRGLSENFSQGNIRVVLCEIHLPTDGPSPSIEDFGSSASEVYDFLENHNFSIEEVNRRDRDYHILAIKK